MNTTEDDAQATQMELLARLVALKNRKRQLEAEIADVEGSLLATELPGWSFEFDRGENNPPDRWNASVIKSSTTKFNMKVLQDFSQEIFDSVTEPKISNEKLEAAIERGEIPVEILDAFIAYQPRKPYIRLEQLPQEEA